MKKIILGLVFIISNVALAESDLYPFPRVYNFGTRVQVQIWNHTERNISCSGPVRMRTESGKSYSQYYFDNIMPRFTSSRIFYARDFQDKIVSVHPSIFCH